MIYLDYNASTPVDPAVREAILPFLGELHGNPTSGHALGRRVRDAVEQARSQVAALLGASADEIIFTSGGTESNNHVIKGVADAMKDRGRHIITSAIEHPAVTNPCRYLEQRGFDVTYLGVDATGLVDPDAVADAIRDDTILVTIMQANNEVGTIQPIEQIAEHTRSRGVLFHTDAAQACGKIDTNVSRLGVDFLTIAGHKVYAPQGIGALYLRGGATIEPLHHGAGHQGGRRGGTEPVAAIVGLGAAAEITVGSLNDAEIKDLRDRLYKGLRHELGDNAVVLGHPELRLPNTLAIGFRARLAVDIMAQCPDVCASFGAACHTGQRERSAVLTAMDVPEEVAFGAIRFSLGRYTTKTEIDEAVPLILDAVAAAALI